MEAHPFSFNKLGTNSYLLNWGGTAHVTINMSMQAPKATKKRVVNA